ncbi:MAG: type II toxin-antitoxin system RelE/ParE family toxin [Deltaproteobacteria bacterium]|nr:type II toxin-antitoxin system RelE/ParE family toxin [Deltaproteobacteria bacterium]
MKADIIITDSAQKEVAMLPKEIRTKFWKQIERLIANPSYPSLRNEKLRGTDQWAFSITMNYRAVCIRYEKSIVIVAVGTHKKVLGD